MDRAEAAVLIRQGAALAAGGYLRIDVPDGAGLGADLAALGLLREHEGTVMQRGAVPVSGKVWGLASQGFG
ncbi:hypothetical protein [Mangrovicoccus ximenensis]|uniref:hypothetical protein n=1 Tax=Mangrovicoccus ximenensis TaxID=1911570 RepID=UPI000D3729E4|nr:hypothetical protein [Mangrovicoccus ximenensis]